MERGLFNICTPAEGGGVYAEKIYLFFTVLTASMHMRKRFIIYYFFFIIYYSQFVWEKVGVNLDLVLGYCRENNIEYKENELMSKHTSFKIGGAAKLIVIPKTKEEISGIIKECNKSKIKYYIIGKGSNLLVSDSGLDCVVILLNNNFAKIKFTHGVIDDTSLVHTHNAHGIIEAEAGASLSSVCNFALENSLSKMEFAWGIPGTIGGAAYMNAGAYGGEMKDVIIKCEHIDNNGNFGEISGEDLKLSYRKSIYSESNFCITKVFMRLTYDKKETIKAKMDDFMLRRKTKQPLEYPSAGSVFKRPPGHFAGALIEECGLKGHSINGAKVSEKHAGFIINTGNATCSDVNQLIKEIQQKVYDKFKINLETELINK